MLKGSVAGISANVFGIVLVVSFLLLYILFRLRLYYTPSSAQSEVINHTLGSTFDFLLTKIPNSLNVSMRTKGTPSPQIGGPEAAPTSLLPTVPCLPLYVDRSVTTTGKETTTH